MDFDQRPMSRSHVENRGMHSLQNIEKDPQYTMGTFFGDAKNIAKQAHLRLLRIKSGENLDPAIMPQNLTQRLEEQCPIYGANIESVQAVIRKDLSYQAVFDDVDQRIAHYNEACQKRPYDRDELQRLVDEIMLALEAAAKKALAKHNAAI